MDNTESRKQVLNELYVMAYDKGLCHSTKEFATLINRNYSSVSAAINGNPKECNDKMILYANVELMKIGLIDNPLIPEMSEPGIYDNVYDLLLKRREDSSPETKKSDIEIMMELLEETKKTNTLLEKLVETLKHANNLD